MYSLKLDTPIDVPPQPTTRYLASVLARHINKYALKSIFGPDVVLVPMPSSSKPLPGGLWVPQRLASAFVDFGLGAHALPILKRMETIPKSAYSAPGHRSSAQRHYETLRTSRLLFAQERVVIIDDVITSGATMVGAASVLAEAYPSTQIMGFAMIRTISNAAEFVKLIDPCVGTITRRGDSTHRDP